MSEAVDALIVDLLDWVSKEERSYTEVMEAWRTSCPRLPVWKKPMIEDLSRECGRMIARS